MNASIQVESSSAIGSQIIPVTPQMAKAWLDNKAEFQRNISTKTVKKYADLMSRGLWKLTPGHAVCISPDGFVVDGQHRLAAVVRSGETILMAVAFNVPTDIFDVIDRGRSRTNQQIAQMAGFLGVYVHAVPAINFLLWNPDLNSVPTWDGSEIADILDYFSEEINIAYPPKHSGASNLINAAIRGAVLRAAICCPDRHADLLRFVEFMAHGMPLSDGSIPINALMLRNAFQAENGANNHASRIRLHRITLNALKHHLAGTQIKHQNNFNRGELKRQPFPIPLDQKPIDMSFAEWVATQKVYRLADYE